MNILIKVVAVLVVLESSTGQLPMGSDASSFTVASLNSDAKNSESFQVNGVKKSSTQTADCECRVEPNSRLQNSRKYQEKGERWQHHPKHAIRQFTNFQSVLCIGVHPNKRENGGKWERSEYRREQRPTFPYLRYCDDQDSGNQRFQYQITHTLILTRQQGSELSEVSTQASGDS